MNQIEADRLRAALVGLYGLAVLALLLVPNFESKRPFEAQASPISQHAAVLMIDDGYYYLKIAQNIAAGIGPSFDGTHQTNGYQPLWLLVLVPVFWLTADIYQAVWLSTLLQLLFFSLSAALFYRISRLFLSPVAAVMAVFGWVLTQLAYRMPLSGMEYSLQVFLLSLAIYYFLSRFSGEQPPPLRSFFILGTLLSLSLLARLDTGLLGAIIGLALIWLSLRQWKLGLLQPLLVYFSPLVLTGLVYLILNISIFGLPFPVSGMIKLEQSQLYLLEDPLYQSRGWPAAKLLYLFWPIRRQHLLFSLPLVVGAFVPPVLWVVGRISRKWMFSGDRRWGVLAWFALLHLLFYWLLYHNGLSFQPWYYVVQPWLTVIVGVGFLEWFQRWIWDGRPNLSKEFTKIIPSAVLFVTVLLTLFTCYRWLTGPSRFSQFQLFYAGAEWVRENVPDDGRVGSWNAGIIGYFSQRPVINLDGLVSDQDFYQNGRFDLCLYWRQEGITHLVDVFERDRELDFMDEVYMPRSELAPCRAKLTSVYRWEGQSGRLDLVVYKIQK